MRMNVERCTLSPPRTCTEPWYHKHGTRLRFPRGLLSLSFLFHPISHSAPNVLAVTPPCPPLLRCCCFEHGHVGRSQSRQPLNASH